MYEMTKQKTKKMIVSTNDLVFLFVFNDDVDNCKKEMIENFVVEQYIYLFAIGLVLVIDNWIDGLNAYEEFVANVNLHLNDFVYVLN